ncbi:MAG: outer membrane beta-barrel protein [Bacteroidota bacterium]
MKRGFCLFLFCMLLGVSPAFSQQIKAALLGGLNLAQVDGDEVYGFYNPGLNLGVQAMAPLGNNFFLTVETNYNQKGAYQGKQSIDSLTREYDLTLNYAQVPVILHYNDKDILTAGVGFAYGRLLKATEIEHSGNAPPYTETREFNQSDWLALFDLQFRVYKRFYANFRYSYSIFPIREREFSAIGADNVWNRKQYNNTLMFRVSYRINEKPATKSEINR